MVAVMLYPLTKRKQSKVAEPTQKSLILVERHFTVATMLAQRLVSAIEERSHTEDKVDDRGDV
jgi:hypothetical protein